jgi:diguanylate cyclase (GGDEF)-like protein
MVTAFRTAAKRAERDAGQLAALRAAVADHARVLHAQMDGDASAAAAQTRRELELSISAASNRGISQAHSVEERRARVQALDLWRSTLALAQPIAPSALVAERQARHRAVGNGTDGAAKLLDRAGAVGRRSVRSDLARAAGLERSATIGTFAIGLGIALLMLHFARRLSVEVIRPVVALGHSANRLSAGDLAHRVVIERDDELGQLAMSFNAMAATIEGSHRHLTRQANHDSLTGLANRAGLRTRLDLMLAQPQRREGIQAVLLIDLDDFKDVNDSLGHSAGDDLLIEVADRLNDVIRPGDLAARLGGDEFAILLSGVPDRSIALEVAERAVRALGEPFSVRDTVVHVGASVGLAMRQGDSTSEEILREADVAMYSAKGHGKNQVRVYDDASENAMAARR